MVKFLVLETEAKLSASIFDVCLRSQPTLAGMGDSAGELFSKAVTILPLRARDLKEKMMGSLGGVH